MKAGGTRLSGKTVTNNEGGEEWILEVVMGVTGVYLLHQTI